MRRDQADAAAPLLALALRLSPDNGHYVNTLGAWQLQMGRGSRARQTLDRAQELIPTSPDPLLNLAVLYQATGDLDLARQQLAAALRLDPDHAAARRLQKKLGGAPLNGTKTPA